MSREQVKKEKKEYISARLVVNNLAGMNAVELADFREWISHVAYNLQRADPGEYSKNASWTLYKNRKPLLQAN